MKVTYESVTISGDAELDDWEDGCQDESIECFYDYPISGPTLEKYLAELGEHLLWRPLTRGDLELDDDDGVLRIAGTVNEDWTPADARQIEEWKAGKRKLYYARWMVRVNRVTRESVSMADIEKELPDSQPSPGAA